MIGFIRKKHKAILKILAVVAVLLGAVIISLPTVVRSNWFKEIVTSRLSKALGRGVHLNGELELVLSFSPKLSFTELLIDNPSSIGKDSMLAIKSLSITGPLVENLRGNYQIDEIDARGTHVLVALNSKGESNWDFSQNSPRSGNQNSAVIHLPIIKKVVLNETSLSFRAGGDTREFIFNDILAGNINLDIQGFLASSFTLDGIPIVLKGDVSSFQSFLSGRQLDIALDIQQEKNKLAATGTLYGGGKLELHIDAVGENLSSLSRLFRTGLPEWKDYQLKGQLTTVFGADESMTLKDLNIKIGERELSGTVKLDFSQDGSLKAALDLLSDSHHLSTEGTYRKNGQIDFHVSASGANLSELSPLVFVELPAWHDYTFNSRITSPSIKQKLISLKALRLGIGKQDLEGEVDITFSPIRFDAKLKSTVLDLRALALDSDIDDSTRKRVVVTDEPTIPFELLKAFEGSIEVEVARLETLRGLEFANTHLTANLKNGELSIPKFSTDALGGSLAGTLKAVADKVDIKLEGKQIDTSQISTLTGEAPVAEGDFNFSVDLRSNGNSRGKMLKTLTGRFELNSENAKLKVPTLKTASTGLFEILAPIFGGASEEESECALVKYELKNGIATSKEQVIKLGDVFIFAGGHLDLPKNEITYNFNVNSTNPALASLIPPFRAFGKLSSPHFAPSISGSIASVVDTAEGATRSAFGVLEGAGKLIIGMTDEKLSGLEICRKAYKSEAKMLSSQIGSVFRSDSPQN